MRVQVRACGDEAYAVEAFRTWDAKVKAAVPAHRLLVFETGKHAAAGRAGRRGCSASPRARSPRLAPRWRLGSRPSAGPGVPPAASPLPPPSAAAAHGSHRDAFMS